MRNCYLLYLIFCIAAGLVIGYLITQINAPKEEQPLTWSYNEYEANVAELCKENRERWEKENMGV